MRKYYLIALTFVTTSCLNTTEEWLKQAKKPVTVYKGEPSFIGNNRYTLIDTEGNIHETGETKLELPNEIK